MKGIYYILDSITPFKQAMENLQFSSYWLHVFSHYICMIFPIMFGLIPIKTLF